MLTRDTSYNAFNVFNIFLSISLSCHWSILQYGYSSRIIVNNILIYISSRGQCIFVFSSVLQSRELVIYHVSFFLYVFFILLRSIPVTKWDLTISIFHIRPICLTSMPVICPTPPADHLQFTSYIYHRLRLIIYSTIPPWKAKVGHCSVFLIYRTFQQNFSSPSPSTL